MCEAKTDRTGRAIDKSKNMVGDFNIPLPTSNKTVTPNISKDIELNNVINKRTQHL